MLKVQKSWNTGKPISTGDPNLLSTGCFKCLWPCASVWTRVWSPPHRAGGTCWSAKASFQMPWGAGKTLRIMDTDRAGHAKDGKPEWDCELGKGNERW